MKALYDGTKMLVCYRIKFSHKKTAKSVREFSGKISFIGKFNLN